MIHLTGTKVIVERINSGSQFKQKRLEIIWEKMMEQQIQKILNLMQHLMYIMQHISEMECPQQEVNQEDSI